MTLLMPDAVRSAVEKYYVADREHIDAKIREYVLQSKANAARFRDTVLGSGDLGQKIAALVEMGLSREQATAYVLASMDSEVGRVYEWDKYTSEQASDLLGLQARGDAQRSGLPVGQTLLRRGNS
jgi:hypothetical protein